MKLKKRQRKTEYRNDTICCLEGYNVQKLQESSLRFLNEKTVRTINDQIDRVFDETPVSERHIFDK